MGTEQLNIAKGTSDPGIDCFDQSAYPAPFHILHILYIMSLFLQKFPLSFLTWRWKWKFFTTFCVVLFNHVQFLKTIQADRKYLIMK